MSGSLPNNNAYIVMQELGESLLAKFTEHNGDFNYPMESVALVALQTVNKN